MFQLRKISALIIVLSVALFLICGPAAAANRILTAGAASGDIGATVSVPVTIDDPAGVGGIAFTMTYDPTVFEFMGLLAGGKVITKGDEFLPVPQPPAVYTTDQINQIKADLFYQANDEGAPAAPTGRVMVAAASAQALTGSNLALFNASFKIKGGNGAYPINLVRTIIGPNTVKYPDPNNDPAIKAGYTTPTVIPALVGTTTPVGGIYTSTDFPVYAATLVAGSITANNAPKYSIGGKVTYEGGVSAAGSTVALKRGTDSGYVLDGQTTADASGNYAFANKIAGTYQIFVTSNNPGYFNNQTDPFAVSANVTGKNIILPAPQRFTGFVTVNSSALAGVQVKVIRNSDQVVMGVWAVNPDGSYQTAALPPGGYTLKAVYGRLESGALTPSTTFNWTPTLQSISGSISGLSGTETVTVSASSATAKLQKTTTATMVAGSGAYSIGNLVPDADYIVSATTAGFPVIYYDGETDIALKTAVDISGGNKTANFSFTSVNKGSISGKVTDVSGNVPNIGVYAFETTTYALTRVATNASGDYTLTLVPGSYEVFVIKANNKTFYYKDPVATQSESAATILTPGALSGKNISIAECEYTMTGFVTYKRAGGDPAANVLIAATSNVGNASAITGPDGAYRLTGLCAGTYQVDMNPLNSRYAIQQATVSVSAPATQNFIIDTGYVLTGKITDSVTSAAVSDATIYLRDQQTGVLANGRMYFSNNTGDYAIADIADGIYNINVTHPLYRSFSESDLDPSITSRTPKNITLVKGYYFNVTVTDGNNSNVPLAGALVIVTREGEIPVNAMTDSNGNCKIYGLGNYSDYIVRAKKDGFDGQFKAVPAPTVDGTAVPFSLIRPAAVFSLSGTITSDCANPNQPVVGAYVLVYSTAKNFVARATTNGSGYYSFSNLPQAADYQFTVVPVGNLQIQIQTGLNYTGNTAFLKSVTLPCGGTITGTVTREGTAPIYVYLYTAAGNFVDSATAEGVAYAFTGLTAGNYKILAVSSGNTAKWYNGKDTKTTADTVPVGTAGVNITLTATP